MTLFHTSVKAIRAAEVHWQANRHLWFQADYGIFYAGQFLKEASPGRNINYMEFWAGYKF